MHAMQALHVHDQCLGNMQLRFMNDHVLLAYLCLCILNATLPINL